MMVLQGKSVRHGLIFGSGVYKTIRSLRWYLCTSNEDLLEHNLSSNKKKTIKETHPKKESVISLNHLLRLTNKNKKWSYYQKCLTRVRRGQEVEILKLKSNAPRLTYLNGFQSHLKIKRCILRLGGEFHALHLPWMRFKPIWRCIPQLGGEFRTLHLVLVYFHVPRLRLVNEFGASVPCVGNHAAQVARRSTMRPTFGNMSPEGR